ncbi:MAG: hypothetical protein U0531_02855 [Dehalococcoidia bacterium]
MLKELIYLLYERRLESPRVRAGPIPHHIGLILERQPALRAPLGLRLGRGRPPSRRRQDR